MIDRVQVVAAARAWVGTPFRAQQHVRGHGCDCAGLLIGVAKELGEIPADFSAGPYKQSPENGKLRQMLAQHLRAVPLNALEPGHVVSFAYLGDPYHVGILVDYGAGLGVVHAVKSRGKVVEHRLDSKWREKINAAYSYPGAA